MKPLHYGLLFAILSPFFSSIATVFKSGAAKTLTPLIVLSIGGILASILLLLFVIFSKEKLSLKRMRANQKDLINLMLSRQLAGEIFFTYGLSLTDAIKAIFFTKVEPYFVLFWNWIIKKERVKRRHLILLTVHITGAILLSTGGIFWVFTKTQLGDLLVVIGMGLLALSYLPGAKLSNILGARLTNAITTGVAGIVLLPLAVLFSPTTTWNIQSVGWLYLLGHVILFNVIALTLWFAALKTVKGWMVSALRALGPIAGAPVAYFLFGETLNLIQIIGGIVVLVTSSLIAREHLRKE